LPRALDIVLSLAGLIISIPLMLLICGLIIVVDSPHVFFIQERLGADRRPFRLIKFRTMNDGQVTVMGKILRAFGLDEIPQLVNVVKGDMSIVGPRPLTHEDVERLGWDTKDRDARWSVKPGITGLAQLSPICDADLSWQLDMSYIRDRSVLLDLKIVRLTARGILLGKNKVSGQLWRLARIESPC
jgi:lipopolysaccharide/colanic/teichoic acid biosynthesis glycosyltransferase